MASTTISTNTITLPSYSPSTYPQWVKAVKKAMCGKGGPYPGTLEIPLATAITNADTEIREKNRERVRTTFPGDESTQLAAMALPEYHLTILKEIQEAEKRLQSAYQLSFEALSRAIPPEWDDLVADLADSPTIWKKLAENYRHSAKPLSTLQNEWFGISFDPSVGANAYMAKLKEMYHIINHTYPDTISMHQLRVKFIGDMINAPEPYGAYGRQWELLIDKPEAEWEPQWDRMLSKLLACDEQSKAKRAIANVVTTNRTGKYCTHHKSSTHDTHECRNPKPHAKRGIADDMTMEQVMNSLLNLLKKQPESAKQIFAKVGTVLNSKASSQYALLIDSGASQTMTADSSLFVSMKPLLPPTTITIADGNTILATHSGTMSIVLPDDRTICVTNSLYAPNLGCTLLSVGQLVEQGYSFAFGQDASTMTHNHTGTLHTLLQHGNLYSLTNQTSDYPAALLSSVELWHQRLGHLGYRKLKQLSTGMVLGIPHINDTSPGDCSGCRLGKSHRTPLPTDGNKSSDTYKTGELVWTDICGPFQVAGLQGELYFLTFTDHASDLTSVYFLKKKSDALECFRHYYEWNSTQSGLKIKVLRSDRGGEYMSKAFDTYLTEHGIVHQTTVPYKSAQNGRSEVLNRILVERALSMLHTARLPERLWPQAVETANYLRNRSPTAHSSTKTPFEHYYGFTPDVSNLRIFGSQAWVYTQSHKRPTGKLSPRATIGVHVGYGRHSKGYRIYDPLTEKISDVHDVHITEGIFNDFTSPPEHQHYSDVITIVAPVFNTTSLPVPAPAVATPPSPPTTADDSPTQLLVHPETDAQLPAISMDGIINPATADEPYPALADDTNPAPADESNPAPADESNPAPAEAAPADNNLIPSLFDRSILIRVVGSTDNDPAYLTAYEHDDTSDDERDYLGSRFTHVPADTPAARDITAGPTHSKRVSKPPNRHALLAVDGHKQGRDIQPPSSTSTSTTTGVPFEPVPKSYKQAITSTDADEWTNAMMNELIAHWMLKTVVPVKRESHMHVLPSQWVYTLKSDENGFAPKARWVIGGHRQTPFEHGETYAATIKFESIRLLLDLATKNDWHVHQLDFRTAFLNADLEEVVYTKPPPGFNFDDGYVLKVLKAVYGLRQSPRAWEMKLKELMATAGYTPLKSDTSVYTNGTTHIGVYVDDCLLVSPKLDEITVWKKKMADNCKVKDLGELHHILGMTWERNRENLTSTLSQRNYVQRLLQRFSHDNAKTITSPAQYLNDDDNTPVLSNNVRYCELIGSLMHLLLTRPDIAYAVSHASSFMTRPTQRNWKMALRILRYLSDTPQYGIQLGGPPGQGFIAYSDSDWSPKQIAGGKSRSGFVIFYGQSPISWKSKLQPRKPALSTVEAEFRSAVYAVRELQWLLNMMKELAPNHCVPSLLKCDNQGAIAAMHKPVQHSNLKHISLELHFLKECVRDHLSVEYCPTKDMIADIFTKALTPQTFRRLRPLLGVTDTSTRGGIQTTIQTTHMPEEDRP